MFFLLFLPVVVQANDVDCDGGIVLEKNDYSTVCEYSLKYYEDLGHTDHYGFIDGEDRGSRDLNDLFDHGYNNSAKIPTFASDFLILDFPDELLSVIEWYQNNREKSVKEIIPGYYSNDKNTGNGNGLSLLSLDTNKKMQTLIQNIMKPILASWAGEKEDNLVFTSLYGIREYHRDAIMIMHLDRHQTHHISAVLHLYQENMEEGWPFTIQVKDKVKEIFCSKPCLILYVSV